MKTRCLIRKIDGEWTILVVRGETLVTRLRPGSHAKCLETVQNSLALRSGRA